MFHRYSNQQLADYYKNGFKLRQKKLASFEKIFVIRSLGGLAFLQNDGFSAEKIDQLGSQLKVKEMIYLLPKKRAKLRRNATQRAIDCNFNLATMETKNTKLKLTKIEKKFKSSIKNLKKKGYSKVDISSDALLLALVFDQFYRSGMPSDSAECLEAIIQIKQKLEFLERASSNAPNRISTIKAHTESLLCLMNTHSFKKVHHCTSECRHALPPIYSTSNANDLNESQGSIYSMPADEFFLPSLTFDSDPEFEGKLCTPFHATFPIQIIPKIRQSITHLIAVDSDHQFQAWKFFQGLCNPLSCIRGLDCESPYHLLQQLEGCFFGAKVLLYTVEAMGKNAALQAMMEEIKVSGKFENLQLCFFQIVSDFQ